MSWGQYVGQVVFIDWRDDGCWDIEEPNYYRVCRVIDTKNPIAELVQVFPPGTRGEDGPPFNVHWRWVEKIRRAE